MCLKKRVYCAGYEVLDRGDTEEGEEGKGLGLKEVGQRRVVECQSQSPPCSST